MTTQEAYEKVRNHLLRPDACRAMANESCSYINRKREMCAIGVLLTPETQLSLKLDDFNESARSLIEKYNPPELEGCNVDFLCHAQSIHDTADNWGYGGIKARAIAELDVRAEDAGLRVIGS